MYDIQEIDGDKQLALEGLFSLVQTQYVKGLKTYRINKFDGLYRLISKKSQTMGIFESNNLCAAVSFISLDNQKDIYLITDLVKRKYFLKSVSVTLKFINHFLELNDLWKKGFCFVFIEENFKSLDTFINYSIKKYHFQIQEELIYSNAFLIKNLQEINKKNNNFKYETIKFIDGVECLYFSDKDFRYYSLNSEKFARAYVEIRGQVNSDDVYLKIIEAGKKYASDIGCNVFILLTTDKRNFQQDYIYVNRRIELRHNYSEESVNLCKKGILI